MKKCTLILASFLLILDLAYAQLEQGNVLLGGGVSFSLSSREQPAELDLGDDVTTNSFSISPQAAYFVADGLALGLSVGYSRFQADVPYNFTNDFGDTFSGILDEVQDEFFVSPFVRKYWYLGGSESRFAFYLQGSLSIAFGSMESEDVSFSDGEIINREMDTLGFGLGISPGFSFFPSPKWGIELGLQGIGFSVRDPNTDMEDDRETFFSFGLDFFNPSLGIFVFL